MPNDRPNDHPNIETLSQYVKRILDEKQLTMKQVQERSQGGIANAYVGSIVNGIAKNPSVSNLKALAGGCQKDCVNEFWLMPPIGTLPSKIIAN